jgi:cleavage stimulation factor subunit 3
LNRDSIANRDLGYAIAKQTAPAQKALGRAETPQTLAVGQSSQEILPPPQKRPGSPDYKKREREVDYGLPNTKRQRGGSPQRERERERERWDPPPRRRYGSPGWDRDRDRDAPPRRYEREREDERTAVPIAISQFLAKLPEKAAFEGQGLLRQAVLFVSISDDLYQGPVFRVDDMLSLIRNAVIPGSVGVPRPRSPVPPPRGKEGLFEAGLRY